MRKITDEKEIKELLASYEFEMFNRKNLQMGELTTLDEKDINNILGDMKMGDLSAVVYVDDKGMVIIKYPVDVCRLESRSLLKK